MSGGLADIERALDRYGVLLQHDGELPSVTGIVAGEPIRGSWWGHPLGHTIYDLLGELEERSGGLSTKIIDAKITYVHPRLWPAFLSLAQEPGTARTAGLSAHAVGLFACVQTDGPIRADALPPALSGTAPALRGGAALSNAPRELTKSIRALEGRLLVHSDSVHTDSGAHVKLLTTWAQWRDQRQVRVSAVPIADAKAELDRAVAALCAGCSRKPKVPW